MLHQGEISNEPIVVNELERVAPPATLLTGDEPKISVVKKPDPILLLANHGIQLIPISAGEFLMGDDDQSDNPRRTVYLDDFLIAKHPITVKQYLAFVKASGYGEPSQPSWGWKDDHPVVNVSWEDAQAYCAWASKEYGLKVSLPTEAQWEKASRGTDGRKYPWGNDWDGSKCGNSVGTNTLKSTVSVGSYPQGASPYGVLDMAGNVREWCSDWYGSGYMKTAPSHNPTGPSNGSARVLRGGSWNFNFEDFFRCAYRFYISPNDRSNYRGFRCVVSADSY